MKRGDTEQIILDVLDEQEREHARVWMPMFGIRDGLSRGIERLHAQRFPERRNRPAYRHIQSALRRLVEEGLVEQRSGENDTYYRRGYV